jgi:beta-xylosidase
VIDATIQQAGKKYVMFLKNENDSPAQKNIRVATSRQLTGRYTNASAPITGKYWAEGPTVLKTGDTWIVYFDKYTEHTYGAVESTDLKHWTDVSHKIALPSGIRHGTVLPITEGELDKLLNADNILVK